MDLAEAEGRSPARFRNVLSILLHCAFVSFLMFQLLPVPQFSDVCDTYAVPTIGGSRSIDDVTSCRIFERYYSAPGAGIGAYFWAGDVNGDNISDIAIPAQGATGLNGVAQDGKVSFLYGGEKWNWTDHDLDTEEPDILIIGAIPKSDPNDPLDFQHEHKLSNHIDAGDINGDGYRDIIFTYTLIVNGGATPGIVGLMGIEGGWNDIIPFSMKRQPSTDHEIRNFGTCGDIQTSRDLQYSDHIVVEDIDDDGIDEIATGFFRSSNTNRVLVRGMSTSDLLDIHEYPGVASRMGKSIAIGDIDGNGFKDIVFGAPGADHNEAGLVDAGEFHILWDLNQAYNGTSLARSDIDVTFTVPRSHSNLGDHIILRDIDSDGKDDIIVGAPGWDGDGSDEVDIGEIYVIKGDVNASFARYMDVRQTAHRILRGVDGEWEQDRETYPGSRIGRMFQICDTNGDGSMEIVVGDHSRTGMDDYGRILSMRGEVSIFDLASIMNSNEKIHYLSDDASIMTITGREEMDSFGYYIQTSDIDGDGFDDILIGSPGGDGPGNMRPRSGEIDIIRGSGLRTFPPIVSGEGARAPYLFRGGGSIDLSIPFSYSKGAEHITGISLELDPHDENIILGIEGNNIDIRNDRFDAVTIDRENSGFAYDGIKGSAKFIFDLNWFTPLSGPLDISYTFILDTGETHSRAIKEIFVISRDIHIQGVLSTMVNNENPLGIGQWLRPGDHLKTDSIFLVYNDKDQKEVHEGPFTWELHLDRDLVGDTENRDDWSLLFSVPEKDPLHYILTACLSSSGPDGFPPEHLPAVKGSRTLDHNVDLEPPLEPRELVVTSGSNEVSGYDMKGEYSVFWKDMLGTSGDPNGSGVKEYIIDQGGHGTFRPKRTGGLFGTYYTDEKGLSVGLERMDGIVDFNTTRWGDFGPEPNYIPPEHFSIRWYGWIRMKDTRDHFFRLRGSGHASMILDGEIVIDGSCKGKGVTSDALNLQGTEEYEVEIYFTHDMGPSCFSFQYRDDIGGFSPLSEQLLLHPSNTIDIKVEQDKMELLVRCIDWSGRSSIPSKGEGILDDDPPEFDISKVSTWYGNALPEIIVTINEPLSSGKEGSGLDLDSIMMILDDNEEKTFGPEEWKIIKINERNGIVKNVSLIFEPVLSRNFKGSISFFANDLVGNTGASRNLFIGVDMEPPEILMLSPNSAVEQRSGNIEFVVRASDHGRSGVDRSTFSFRTGGDDTFWSEWKSMNGTDTDDTKSIAWTFSMEYGTTSIQFQVSDLMGNVGRTNIYDIAVMAPRINELPVPVISSPLSGSTFNTKDIVHLDATGTYDDGKGPLSEVRLTWISNISGIIGNGEEMDIYPEPGFHRITLYADDGMPGHNISTSVNITVIFTDDNDDSEQDEPGPNIEERTDPAFFILIALLVMILIIFISLLVVRYTRKDDKQILIKIRERTEDDLSYNDLEEDR